MELYNDIHDAVSDFVGYQRRFTKIRESFEEFFANLNPDTLQIAGMSVEIDALAGICEINAFQRKFFAKLSPLVIDKEIIGHVEFGETIGQKRTAIERFLINPKFVMTLARKPLIPISDFTNVQTLYILNLVRQGLSKPVILAE
ncbi:hypothetical protein [Pseudomonas koreensis]|uniref:Uncharacterized protein n=1 Tax=Pseudomonas koreensis TaxID=198620 RepID=A0AA94JEG8_9PSED|nr:hypothetical protein [Pseudomonas koreensis]RVD74326.1 hypothetical protein A9HBioS_5777 [Pseudomonas koreensis]